MQSLTWFGDASARQGRCLVGFVRRLLDFINNASVAAFVGAFCAFLLVMATDSWRRRRRKRLFAQLLADAVKGAEAKAVSLARTWSLLSHDDTVQPGEPRKFPTVDLMALRLEVASLLSAEERLSLDVLLFCMEAANHLLDKTEESAEQLYCLYIDKAVSDESRKLKRKLLLDLYAAVTTIRNVSELGKLYLAGSHAQATQWRPAPAPRGEDILARVQI